MMKNDVLHVTNAKHIRSMTDEELAQWIEDIAFGRQTPWSRPFGRKFCDNCETTKCKTDDGRIWEMHECDFSDGVCPHGSDILWWLRQPEEGEHEDER